jgi:xanthine dehydrogenase accessory factor
MDVFEDLVRLRREGRRCALATVVDAHGSVPGFAAAKLLIRDDGSIAGTIGGGSVESAVRDAGMEVLRTEESRRMSFDLGGDIAVENGLICGGRLEVFIEPVVPAPRACIFGAGHISLELCRILAIAGFSPVIVDHRPELANRNRFPDASDVRSGEYEEIFPALRINSEDFLVIVTAGHQEDLRVLRMALPSPARYLAMVGSKRKVAALACELADEGVLSHSPDRVFAPMGLDIGAVSPGEIAVSVAAEMIALRRAASSNWRAVALSSFADASAKAAKRK